LRCAHLLRGVGLLVCGLVLARRKGR
jgi:hypothetical protein